MRFPDIPVMKQCVSLISCNGGALFLMIDDNNVCVI